MRSKLFPGFLLMLSFLVFAIVSAVAQIEDLTEDKSFFENQAKLYQRWLDQVGLGSNLLVYDLDVQPERLSVYLAFPTEDVDTIMVIWRELEAQFIRERGITLEQQLFYKAVHLMEVRQSMVDIQIYDTYDLRRDALFMRAIYFEDGKVQVAENNPKSKIREIGFVPDSFTGMKALSVEDFKQQYDRATVYDTILLYAKKRYQRRICEHRYPKVRELENEDILRFEVTNLCREVLTDEANPMLCELLKKFGYDCNWVKREKLTFTINYRPADTGFRLAIEIDGKYGSGLYENVRRGGYIDMEIDFDDYLEIYADDFRTKLRKVILNGNTGKESSTKN